MSGRPMGTSRGWPGPSMSLDVTELAAFYAAPLGGLACRQVGRVLGRMWADLRGLRLLGLGYATPYLGAVGEGCERILAFMPAGGGAQHWPDAAASASVVADPLVLPLADASIDRVLVVHALETAPNPAELLHELARILSPAGRVILVCPNRRGLWARMDTTPFGQGQPFSRKQLRRLMRDTLLAPERWAETLYAPPLANPLVLRSAAVWERCGAGLSLPFAGVHVVEAVKKLRRPVPVRETRLRPARRPVFVPVSASRAAS